MQHHAKSSKIMSCKNHAKIVQNELSSVYRHTDYTNRIFQRKTVRNKLHTCTDPEDARPTKKTGPVKKEWQVGRDNDSRSRSLRTAAPGLARGRMDGAVVLNLRRGPGAYALLSRADGQLTRAGQHYYSHLGLRPPSKDFDYNQPLIREGPNDHILLRNGQKKLVRSLQGGEHRLTKLGKGFFRDKCYEYLVHVPVIIRGRCAAGGTASAGTVNELGGATRHPAHLTEEQVAQRVRQQVEASLDPGGPVLQLSYETYFLDPEGHWVISTQHALQELQDRGGDAPAPAHEGPEECELPAAL